MWAAVLLFILFVAGLISTNFPRKKLVVWVESFWVGIRGPRYENILEPDQSPTQNDRDVKKNVKTDVSRVQLRSVFATFDKNNDGFITKMELRDSLKNIGIVMSERDVDDMIRRVDANGDGLIDLDEFCESFDSLIARGAAAGEAVEEQSELETDGDLQEAFDVFDGDKDGVITVEELGLVLSSLGFKEGKKMEACKEMIRQVDMDGDGMVNFLEFKKMMKSGHRLVPIS